VGANAGPQAVPVLVETPAFSSRARARESRLADGHREPDLRRVAREPGGFATGAIVETLAPGEQRVLPNAIDFLRGRGAAVGPKGGPTRAPSSCGSPRRSHRGRVRRSADDRGGAGRRRLRPLCAGVPLGETAEPRRGSSASSRTTRRARTWHFSTPSGSQGAITLQIDVFDGDSGRAVATGIPVALAPGSGRSSNAILKGWALSNGYVRVTRTAGRAGWVAYGVLNDGSAPGAGTSDGSYVVMTPGP